MTEDVKNWWKKEMDKIQKLVDKEEDQKLFKLQVKRLICFYTVPIYIEDMRDYVPKAYKVNVTFYTEMSEEEINKVVIDALSSTPYRYIGVDMSAGKVTKRLIKMPLGEFIQRGKTFNCGCK